LTAQLDAPKFQRLLLLAGVVGALLQHRLA
jgi:hypothetical protein